MKPRVFIGSSSEQVDTAYAIQRGLERTCDATVWDQGVFALTSNVLDDLIAALDRSDFGIFVFGPDDLTTIRSEQFRSTRDNVVFELGLFIGKLGKGRTFFVLPRERAGFRLPSDLMGVTPAEFDETRDDRQAALGPACSQIRQQMMTLGIRPERHAQPAVDRIVVDKVLCVSSARYEALGIEQDLAIVEEAFPGRVVARRSSRALDLQGSMMSLKPQVLHLLMDIDPTTGSLIFDHGPTRDLRPMPETRSVETGGATAHGTPDVLRLEGFAKLVELYRPELVVLATCDALFTASRITRFTNVVAASGQIAVEVIVAWQRAFYGALANGESLSDAFELANAMSDATVVLHLKRNFVVASP